MGEFERSGMAQKRGIAWAIWDVFTAANFEIAAVSRAHQISPLRTSSKKILGKRASDFWLQKKQQ
jgi:hypothetical protein